MEVCHSWSTCWKKYVIVEICFKGIYGEAMHNVGYSLLLLPVDQDVELSVLSLVPCLPAYCHIFSN